MDSQFAVDQAVQDESDSDQDHGSSDSEIEEIQKERIERDRTMFRENVAITGEEAQEEEVEEGVVFTGFNLEELREEGRFSKGGSYLEKEKEIDDPWMEELYEREQQEEEEKLSKRKKRKTLDELKLGDKSEVVRTDQSSYLDSKDLNAVRCREIIQRILLPGESVAMAVQRLSGKSKGTKPNTRKRKRKPNRRAPRRAWELSSSESEGEDDQRDGHQPQQQPPSSSASSSSAVVGVSSPSSNQESFHQLTEAANKLIQFGDFDVYTDSLDEIASKLELSKTVRWEYKWNDEDEDSTIIRGPYTTEKMLNWEKMGFFGDKEFLYRVYDESRIGEDAAEEDWESCAKIDFEMAVDLNT